MIGRSAAEAEPPVEIVAGVAARLAVLLSAGVAPASAWSHLAESTAVRAPGRRAGPRQDPAGCREVAAAAADAAAHGESVGLAIVAAAEGTASTAWRPIRLGDRRSRGNPALDAWRALAAAWDVASVSGAPVAAALAELADSLRSLGQARREVEVALAGPRATARMIGALPLVGLLFGTALGADSLGVLLGTGPGLVCLVAGLVLLGGGQLWTAVLVRGATPRAVAPGLSIDLVAVALGGGGSLDAARSTVDRALAAFVAPSTSGRGRTAWRAPAAAEAEAAAEASVIDDVLELASRAGVPAGRLLRGEAELVRRRVRMRGQRAAAGLSVTLMIPLGLCVLPSFMLLGVAPLVISILRSTIGGLSGGVVPPG